MQTMPYTNGYVLQTGKFNWMPFIGLLGWQMQYSDSIIGGDDRAHFSLWSHAGNVPQEDTPEQWAEVQQLYDEDVCRNGSQANWWWSGITLEYLPSSYMANDSWAANLVAYPLMVRV